MTPRASIGTELTSDDARLFNWFLRSFSIIRRGIASFFGLMAAFVTSGTRSYAQTVAALACLYDGGSCFMEGSYARGPKAFDCSPSFFFIDGSIARGFERQRTVS